MHMWHGTAPWPKAHSGLIGLVALDSRRTRSFSGEVQGIDSPRAGSRIAHGRTELADLPADRAGGGDGIREYQGLSRVGLEPEPLCDQIGEGFRRQPGVDESGDEALGSPAQTVLKIGRSTARKSIL